MRVAMAGALLFAACEPAPLVHVIVEGAPSTASLRSSPAGFAREATVQAGRLIVGVARGTQGRIELPGACPIDVNTRADEVVRVAARRRVRVRAPEGPIGFRSAFSLDIETGCPEARPSSIEWRQTSGAPLEALMISADGRRLSARTIDPPGQLPPWGLVPLSSRSAGHAVVRVSWRDGDETGAEEVAIAAAPRASGLPNMAPGARVHLAGGPWRIAERPAGARSNLAPAAGMDSLVPDTAGVWRLIDAQDRELAIDVRRYDETPLDCGRSGCHEAITAASEKSKMASVLARALDGPARAPGYPACALACHAAGEPGAPDGGFAHVAGELGVGDALAGGWADLPRPLRRLGGVGCLACHGPGAIPAASARWTVLRSDLCAVCHDAPPRYGHALAWGGTRMARADADTRARTDAACARCHTTWGFLAAAGEPHADGRRPPEQAGPVGITCSACHAVHGPKTGAVHALLRSVPAPEGLGPVPPLAARSSVCLPCHSPGAGGPAASAAALWLGRGGLDPQSGRPLGGPAPHLPVAGGCVGCHRSGDPGLRGGRGHAFRPDAGACRACHPGEPAAVDLRSWADRVWRQYLSSSSLAVPAGGPPHAAAPRLDLSTPAGRAAWNTLLVLEDRAAAVHNRGYAELLLRSAEAALGPPSSPPTTRRSLR